MTKNPTRLLLPTLSTLLTAAGLWIVAPASTATADDSRPMLRLICAASLGQSQEVVVATKTDEGKWRGLADVELRQALVSNWMPVQVGELHIAVREEGGMKSLGKFTYPVGARRMLVALCADAESKTYSAHAIDPDKEGFGMGEVLVINTSGHKVTVSLGSKEFTSEPGRHFVAKVAPEDAGGYRMTVAHSEGGDEPTLCYDRQAVPNPNSRSTLILLPDPDRVIQVTSLSEFDLSD